MISHASKLTVYFKKNHFVIAFSLLWFAGILTGFGLFLLCKPFLFLQMRSVIVQPVSIVGLCCSIFLPLLCTYTAVLTNRSFLALSVCFIKAASFCFTLSWISALYDTASWLLSLLFMFSDSCFMLVMFLLWMRYPSVADSKCNRIFCCSAFWGLLISFGDYFVISPFLNGLF